MSLLKPAASFLRTLQPDLQPILRPVRLVALLALILLLGSCGFTDPAGTNYKIVFESATYGEDDSLAPIGVLRPGELVHVTFEVTPKDGTAVDRTELAQITLENVEPEDDASAFTFTLSPDLDVQPYHTLTSTVQDAQAALCFSYDGPEVLDGPVEDCAVIVVDEWPDS